MSMPLTLASSFDAPHSTLLHQARVALQRGDVELSQAISKSALLHTKRLGDVSGQARALLCLAQGDRQMSRMRRARDTAERATHLFQLERDAMGEAEALNTLSHVLSSTGHHGKGAEAAMQAIRICETLDPVGEALAYNYLGVAQSYGQSFDKAAQAFQKSISLLESEGLWADSCLPRAHWRAAELYRCFLDRYCQGSFSGLDRLKALRTAPEDAFAPGRTAYAFTCPLGKSRALLELTRALESCWTGDVADAVQRADAVCARVDKGADQPTVRLMEVWLRAEIAWAQGDWTIAEAHGQRLQLLSLRSENEHMRALAYLLQAQIFAAQGKDGLAQTQLRLMKAHEAQLRNENLNSASDLLNPQLRSKPSAKTIRLAPAPFRPDLFSHQDSLTGLYNRRYLERAVPGILAKCAEDQIRPTMVLLDVHAFQQINALYSRAVGDEVLKALAHILRSVRGGGDVLARLGGDEFVVLYVHTPPREAIRQLRDAVLQYDWRRLHTSLEVDISGVRADAELDDTLDSWLHRCEMAMCVEKNSRHDNIA